MAVIWLYPNISPCADIGGQINYKNGVAQAAYCPPGVGTRAGQWGVNSDYYWYRLLWKWPLDSIPPGQEITEAVLHIRYMNYYGGGTMPQLVDAYHITTIDPDEFPQDSIDVDDWDTAADLIEASWGGYPIWGTDYDYKTLDVTVALKSDYDNGRDWFPLRLRGNPEDTDLINWVFVGMNFDWGTGERPDGTSDSFLPLIRVQTAPTGMTGLNPAYSLIL